MQTVLVTGATAFLGYHVVKRLNGVGIRPRVLERPDAASAVLNGPNVDRVAGNLEDRDAVRAACRGANAVLHLAYSVSMEGGAKLLDEMRRVNVSGTVALLRAAAAEGVRRAVVVGSSLAVGVNRDAAPLDETADWSRHGFDLPYALIRREAEAAALAEATARFEVVSVCPSLTFGPDDPTGAPANRLLAALISGKLRFTLPVGFSCLDVRDFADGAIRACEMGRSGERYLLTGENVTTDQLLARASAIAGIRPPRFRPPMLLVRGVVSAIELASRVRRRPAPITRDVLQIVGRYAWYDASKARTELGWAARPLDSTLADTIDALRRPPAAAPNPVVT